MTYIVYSSKCNKVAYANMTVVITFAATIGAKITLCLTPTCI